MESLHSPLHQPDLLNLQFYLPCLLPILYQRMAGMDHLTNHRVRQCHTRAAEENKLVRRFFRDRQRLDPTFLLSDLPRLTTSNLQSRRTHHLSRRKNRPRLRLLLNNLRNQRILLYHLLSLEKALTRLLLPRPRIHLPQIMHLTNNRSIQLTFTLKRVKLPLNLSSPI